MRSWTPSRPRSSNSGSHHKTPQRRTRVSSTRAVVSMPTPDPVFRRHLQLDARSPPSGCPGGVRADARGGGSAVRVLPAGTQAAHAGRPDRPQAECPGLASSDRTGSDPAPHGRRRALRRTRPPGACGSTTRPGACTGSAPHWPPTTSQPSLTPGGPDWAAVPGAVIDRCRRSHAGLSAQRCRPPG